MPGIPGITLRHCCGLSELDACVELQRRTWGYDATDVLPRRAFIVAQRIGGQVVGAFSSDRGDGADALVGFAMALPGIRDGSPYLHSHMLAVVPEYRNRGLGYALKLSQRDDALARGIHRMEWTFDPLEIKNAYFNLSKLGAIARTYADNVYGVSSSRLQGGRPTDRLIAEWWMNSPRAEAALSGAPIERARVEECILLPAEVMAWKESAEESPRAVELQARNRESFRRAFARGLAVTNFSRDKEGNGSFELSRWTPDVPNPLLQPEMSKSYEH